MRIVALLVVLGMALAQSVELKQTVGGLSRPLFLTHASDGSGRLFILEQEGKIRILSQGSLLGEPFLDLSGKVSCCGERGLLGLAFHPNYPQNGLLYVNYTNRQGSTVVSRFSASGNRANPASEQILLTVEQPYPNHNGGMMAFGPDGLLYIGMGDGGSGGDPQNHAQNLNSLLGKFLRIDVNRSEGRLPYGIPKDNPFVGRSGARAEIWSYGWRNPWRFSFDRETGDLWAADVGQNQWEEVHFEPANTPGLNYGWRILEGTHCQYSNPCSKEGLVLPVLEYDHNLGQSITGGYRYRGSAMPAFRGTYFYADFSSGRIWAATPQGKGWQARVILNSGMNISSFGEDANGELYVVDYRGSIHRMAQK